MPETKTGHGYVVQSGTLGGEYARGSIVPEGRFEDERIDHWVAKGVIRRATDEDIEAAKGIQPSGSILDTGSRAEVLTPEEQATANKSAREAEILATEQRLERLKKEHEEATSVEEERAKEQTRAMEAAKERLGTAESPKAPSEEPAQDAPAARGPRIGR